MVGGRLVKLIETNSERLSQGVVQKLHTSERTLDYRTISEHDLYQAVLEIYRYLSDWLLTKTESDIELRFTRTGSRRAEQGVSLSNFIWALIVIKEQLWAFLQREVQVDRPVELFAEVDLLYALEQFFDRGMYYAAIGYAQYHREKRAREQAAEERRRSERRHIA